MDLNRCGSHQVWVPPSVGLTRCGSHQVRVPPGVGPTRCGSHHTGEKVFSVTVLPLEDLPTGEKVCGMFDVIVVFVM